MFSSETSQQAHGLIINKNRFHCGTAKPVFLERRGPLARPATRGGDAECPPAADSQTTARRGRLFFRIAPSRCHRHSLVAELTVPALEISSYDRIPANNISPAIEISHVAVAAAAPVPTVLSRFPGMVWPPVPYPLPREASIRKICHSAPHLHSRSRRCSGSRPPSDATPTSGPAVPPR
ncbi:hypothetical protein PVAP13_9NG091973 [Panicum virgatum]|uniref:Uncharacterized protein n=1 Tax=Panicum virgatum TaxID=38727 RepID=A0A8T0MLG1_PANVG|nr:hypothetical protein PVAP13_9NG091973 [Panicum virgatum]